MTERSDVYFAGDPEYTCMIIDFKSTGSLTYVRGTMLVFANVSLP